MQLPEQQHLPFRRLDIIASIQDEQDGLVLFDVASR